MSKLIIAEKPSMMKKYMKALSGYKDVKFTASVGHIEGLIPPERYFENDKMYWKELVQNLPLVPDEFKIEINKKDVYDRIVDQLKSADEIILACDPDREGELIHRNILEIARKEGYVKTENITRVWLHAETDKGIQDGFDKRKNYLEYDGYYHAANTRMIIDWLIGIQLTVLYSVKFGKPGAPVSVGRVQSWLLSEIVERYNQNKNFIPQDFWRILFTSKEGVKFNYVDSEGKIIDILEENRYSELFNSMKDRALLLSKIDKKPFTEYAPTLFDLSTLQKEAAKKYGITPEKTLEAAQKLYEDYNLISYPRTDCNVISDEEAKHIYKSLELVELFPDYKNLVESVKTENPKIELNKKYKGKIKGHYAIIPVFSYDKKTIPILQNDEKNIFDLIVKRFIATLLPPIKGDKTVINAHLDNNESLLFLANIKNITDEGYKKYFRAEKEKDDEDEDNTVSVNYKEKDIVEGIFEGKQDKTKPKELFNDTSIIALMERAHLSIQDEKLRESLKDANGIGTAATRSSFIPLLISRGYILKEKKFYIPTQKGLELYRVLPDELKKADFSAKLEFELGNMIDKTGKTTQEVIKEAKELLEKVFAYINGKATALLESRKSYGSCPKCGESIIKGKVGYRCSQYKKTCDFYFSEEIAGKTLSEKEVSELFEKGRTSLIKGFTGKTKKFDAFLKINEDKKVVFSFEEADTEKIICPVCKKGAIVERESFWGCGDWKNGCKFTISKEIAKKKLTKKEMTDLCKTGKTEPIEGFVAKASGNIFKAGLVIKEGKVVFDFGDKPTTKPAEKSVENPPSKEIQKVKEGADIEPEATV